MTLVMKLTGRVTVFEEVAACLPKVAEAIAQSDSLSGWL